MDVVKVGSRETASFDAAERLYVELEAQGFGYISTLSNTPKVGVFTVRWGHYVEPAESAFEWEMRTLARIARERRDEEAHAFTANCEAEGRSVAARQFAERAGYSGRDAEVFCFGFAGVSAKVADPRSEGREGIFREGRIAWGSSEGQRAWRVESVRARSVLPPVPERPFNPGCGLIANGEF